MSFTRNLKDDVLTMLEFRIGDVVQSTGRRMLRTDVDTDWEHNFAVGVVTGYGRNSTLETTVKFVGPDGSFESHPANLINRSR
jgi:hypothetical protein